MVRTLTLVCTANHPGGWNFSTTNDHYNKTITINIYRFDKNGKYIAGPKDGKSWKYGKAKNRQVALESIRDCADKIGLAVGALKVYEGQQ